MTVTSSPPNRWVIAWAGVIVLILGGTVYAWSNFTQPLIASFGWTSTQASLVFGVAIFCFSIGAVIGGRWQDRAGPRTITCTGIVMWGLGNVLAAIGPHEVWWWGLTYGLIGGFGNGMSYIGPVATALKWFPDKRGLAGGLVVMGFGFGAFFYGFVLRALPAFVVASKDAGAYGDAKSAAIAAGTHFDAAAHAMSAADIHAILTVFTISGCVYAGIGGLLALLLRDPPADYRAGRIAIAVSSQQGSFTSAQMLRVPQFYLLWLMLFANVVGGFLVVSNAVPIIRELLSKGVTDPESMRTLTSTAVSTYAFVAGFNALGRVFWGAISDRIGRAVVLVCVYACQATIFFVLPAFHSVPLVLFAFAIILACYGGGIGTMPSFSAAFFGTKFLGQNYGFTITASGIGALVGPYIAGAVKDNTGSYSGALTPMAAVFLLAIVLPFVARKPAHPSSTVADDR
jgi:MFS family permease